MIIIIMIVALILGWFILSDSIPCLWVEPWAVLVSSRQRCVDWARNHRRAASASNREHEQGDISTSGI